MAGPDVLQCVLRPESVEAHYERVHIWAARHGRYRSIIFMCKKNTDLSDTLRAEEAILASIGSQQMHNMALHRDFQNQGRPYFWSVSFVILWH